MTQSRNKSFCPNCGTEVAPDMQFCARCGTSLSIHAAEHTRAVEQEQRPQLQPTVVDNVGSRPADSQDLGMLQGRYSLKRKIGQGGFGAVYEATDKRVGDRRVAVKEMNYAQSNLSEKAEAIRDFEYEAKLLGKLEHPNFPKVIDFFEENQKAYIVMEFVDGKTLQKIQEEAMGQPLEEARVLNWALQLCEVLNYLHTQPEPIIFRDLKPANIMITRGDKVKLIDFGIARIFKPSASGDTRMVLSPNFAPPEQFGIGNIQTDPRSDIYALGATLYVLLTNKLPPEAFKRMGNPTILEQPSRINPNISPGTEAILHRALAMNPSQRFQSVADMAVEIVALKQSQTIPQPTGPRKPSAGSGPSPITTKAKLSSGGGYSETAWPDQNNNLTGTSWPDDGSGGGTGGWDGNGGNNSANNKPPRRTFLKLAVAGGVVIAVGGAGFLAYENFLAPITLDFAFSTEKQAWLNPIIADFNAQNKKVGNRPIVINTLENGSVAMQEQIVSQQKKPAIWSPASLLEINQLSAKWGKSATEIIATSGPYVPVSLVSSPLVFAVWSERVDILLKYYQNEISWTNIHDALQKKTWSTLKGKKEWGVVKFGQTKPTSSNSGLLTTTLLAYEAASKQNSLTTDDVNSPAFQQYLKDFDNTVFNFGLSSEPYIQDIAQNGPSKADIICIYENLVLSAELQKTANKWNQSLQIFYPDLNILSDHPFAILQAPWVKEEQKAAALEFQKFLLDDAQQKKAVALGFRPSPSNTSVHITDATINQNSFALLTNLSPNHPLNQQPIQPVAQPPKGEVIDALLATWSKIYS